MVTIAERPELLREAYPLAAEEGYADLAVAGDVVIKLDDWLADEATLPGGRSSQSTTTRSSATRG